MKITASTGYGHGLTHDNDEAGGSNKEIRPGACSLKDDVRMSQSTRNCFHYDARTPVIVTKAELTIVPAIAQINPAVASEFPAALVSAAAALGCACASGAGVVFIVQSHSKVSSEVVTAP